MANHESGWKLAQSGLGLHRRPGDDTHRLSAEERRILELIFVGAPLPTILNNVCTAIDVWLGNVVSLISLPEEEESRARSIGQSVTRFGLTVFLSTTILARDRSLLGTLQIYCCDHRSPTPHELSQIERLLHLAAAALQDHKDSVEYEKSFKEWNDVTDGDARLKPPFVN
jgi:hypothetical protein